MRRSYRILYVEKGAIKVMAGDQQFNKDYPVLPTLDPSSDPFRIDQVCLLRERCYLVLSRESDGREADEIFKHRPSPRLLLLSGVRSRRKLSAGPARENEVYVDAGKVYTEYWRVDAIWPADEERAYCVISRGPVSPFSISGRLALMSESLPIPVAKGHITWIAGEKPPHVPQCERKGGV